MENKGHAAKSSDIYITESQHFNASDPPSPSYQTRSEDHTTNSNIQVLHINGQQNHHVK